MPQTIRDEHTLPPNYFPNNDISALDGGSWNMTLPSQIVDRSGKKISESEETQRDGSHRSILAALDFNREEHVTVSWRLVENKTGCCTCTCAVS